MITTNVKAFQKAINDLTSALDELSNYPNSEDILSELYNTMQNVDVAIDEGVVESHQDEIDAIENYTKALVTVARKILNLYANFNRP